MTISKRKFTLEFKLEAARLVIDSGGSVPLIAEKLSRGTGGKSDYFIQAGEVQIQQQARSGLFSIFSTSPIQGPFYEYFNPTDSGEIVFPCMYYRLADWWNFSVLYNSGYGGIFYLTAHDLSEPRSAVSLANPAPNAGCPVTSRSGKPELFSEVTIGLPGMASTYYNKGNSPAADWVIEQPGIGNGNYFELGNFQLAQVKNAEAGYYKTSNQSGSLHNPYNFKLGNPSLFGCYNTNDEGEIGSCYNSLIDTFNAQGQYSTTVIPTPGKQGFDVRWNNCGIIGSGLGVPE